MSHLEKQAKTIKDFYQDCICQIISKGKHPKKFDEQQKWVPLKEAQKAFVDNEVLFKAAYIRITELEGKVESANEILANAKKFLDDIDETHLRTKDVIAMIEDLQECLSQENITEKK